MSTYQSDPPSVSTVDAKKLWAGGVATAIVAALTAMMGLMIVRDLLDLPVVTPAVEFGNSQVATVSAYAVGAALLATGLLHVLLVTTPSATNFFGWIGVLATIAAALSPFAASATLGSKIGSAAIYFAVGLAVVSLLTGIAGAATAPQDHRPVTP